MDHQRAVHRLDPDRRGGEVGATEVDNATCRARKWRAVRMIVVGVPVNGCWLTS